MKAKRMFHPQKLLDAARLGRLKGTALRTAIRTAEELGNDEMAEQLRCFVLESSSFARDATPAYLMDRMVLALRTLAAQGTPNESTKVLRDLMRRYGVIKTINRTAPTPVGAETFQRLSAAGRRYLSPESIVLDRPHLFDPNVVAVAQQRLHR